MTDADSASTTVTVDEAYTLRALFTVDQQSLTVSSGSGGSVMSPGEGVLQYDYGSEILLAATAESGYRFTRWSGDLSSTSNPVVLTVDGDYNVTANFAQDAVTLTLSSTDGGAVVSHGEAIVECERGQEVSVEAAAEEGFRFVFWAGTAVDTGKVADPFSAVTTVIVDDDQTLRATFVSSQHVLSVSSAAGGLVISPGEGMFEYDHGTMVWVAVVADSDYHFTRWAGTAVERGKVADSAASSTTVRLDGDYTLTAGFRRVNDQVSIVVTSTIGGSVVYPGSGVFGFKRRTEVPVLAISDPGYSFVQWSGSAVDMDKVKDPALASTSVMVDENCALEAAFLPVERSAPVVLWERTFGGNRRDTAKEVEITSDGGYIVVGDTQSATKGGYDIYLIKLRPSGDTEWEMKYGGTANDWGWSVKQTPDAGYVVAGETYSFGGGGDAFLARIDSSGILKWLNTYGGTGQQSVHDVKPTRDGGYIMAGNSTTSGDLGRDVYLAKTDSSGQLLWARTFGGPYLDIAESVEETEDGGFIVAGTSYKVAHGDTNSDVYLIWTDSSGELIRQQKYGYPQWGDEGKSIAPVVDGGYIVAGGSGYGGPASWDAYLLRISEMGEVLWEQRIGASNVDVARSIIQTSDQTYVVTGGTLSFGAGARDLYMFETDSDNLTFWEATYGTAHTDRGWSVREVSRGEYVLCGSRNEDAYVLRLRRGSYGPEEDSVFDLNADSVINAADLNILSARWKNTDCAVDNGCQGADFNGDGNVDWTDLYMLAHHWLRGTK